MPVHDHKFIPPSICSQNRIEVWNMYETCVKHCMKHTLHNAATIPSVGFLQPDLQKHVFMKFSLAGAASPLGFISWSCSAKETLLNTNCFKAPATEKLWKPMVLEACFMKYSCMPLLSAPCSCLFHHVSYLFHTCFMPPSLWLFLERCNKCAPLWLSQILSCSCAILWAFDFCGVWS